MKRDNQIASQKSRIQHTDLDERGNRRNDERKNRNRENESNDYNDFMTHNYGPASQVGEGSPTHNATQNKEDVERNTGSSDGYKGFGKTGYGATGSNNRDENRSNFIGLNAKD